MWDYCLDPSTPVLTDDLRWVEVGKLEVGDRLAGFDENKVLKNRKAHRYWHSSEVVNTRRVVLPTFRVVGVPLTTDICKLAADAVTEIVVPLDSVLLFSSDSGCCPSASAMAPI